MREARQMFTAEVCYSLFCFVIHFVYLLIKKHSFILDSVQKQKMVKYREVSHLFVFSLWRHLLVLNSICPLLFISP